MSKQYKEYIDKLCEKADNGNIEAAQELVKEAEYWSAKVKEMKERDNKNKD